MHMLMEMILLVVGFAMLIKGDRTHHCGDGNERAGGSGEYRGCM